MLNIAIVGTSWISRQFADAVHESGSFNWTALCSRTQEKGSQFIKPGEKVQIYTSLSQLCDNSSVDVIYIASPNSLHFAQTVEAIEHDKHVIVEKPAFSNPTEFANIQALLQQHPSVRMFEAARNVHTVNFASIAKKLSQMDTVNGATLSYMKYSSKMPMLEDPNQGIPNVFSPEFSGGALQDLGVYLVYDAIALFGVPQDVSYTAQMLVTGVDGMGTAVLRYKDFVVTLITSKTVDSSMRSEIYGTKDYISMDDGGELRNVFYSDASGKHITLGEEATANPMLAEVKDFAQILASPQSSSSQEEYQRLLQLSADVNATLWKLRRSAGIVFRTDKDA